MGKLVLLTMLGILQACAQTTKQPLPMPSSKPDASATRDADIVPSPDANTIRDASAIDAGFKDATSPVDAGEGFPREVTLGGQRPAIMHVPESYDGTMALPVIVQLHGYSLDADQQESYFQMATRVDSRGFFLIRPNGTREASVQSHRFWNAIPNACCNFYGSPVDDVAYLLGLINEAKSRFAVDASRVYLIGYSNGGFMSYRMACEHADQITAIVSLAGSTYLNESDCGATEPVSVLQIHGDRDTIVPYDGFQKNGYAYPGAQETIQRWATRAGCDVSQATAQPAIDLDSRLAGDETEVTDYTEACTSSTGVSLWRIRNGTHGPALKTDFRDLVLDWLFLSQK